MVNRMKALYNKCRVAGLWRLVRKKLKCFTLSKEKKYAGRPLMSAEQANHVIKDAHWCRLWKWTWGKEKKSATTVC